MSVRTRSGHGHQNGGAVNRPKPPPPAFAPPTLPKPEQDVTVYIRTDKSNIEISENSTTANGHNVIIEDVVLSPKVVIEQSNTTETINVTLGPRKSSKIDQVNDLSKNGPSQQNLINVAKTGPIQEKTPICKIEEDSSLDCMLQELETNETEIRNKCNDVKEILNRIMSNNQNDDDEEEELGDKNNDINHMNDKNVQVEKPDPFENIDNIADLTIDQVRSLLVKEEETNDMLKTELISKKDEQVDKVKSYNETRSRNRVNQPKKSKKEMQLEKMKNFLKDPDKNDEQEINLDIRFKKTVQQKEKLSPVITEVSEGLTFANFDTVKKIDNQHKILLIGTDPNSEMTKPYSNLPLESEEELSSDHFAELAERIHDELKNGNKVIMTSACYSSGLSASLCIPYLVKYQGMQVTEAVQHIQGVRPTVELPPAVTVKLEDWARSDTKNANNMDSISSVSLSWLPMVFFLLFLFLLLRTVISCIGLDMKSVVNVSKNCMSVFQIFTKS